MSSTPEISLVIRAYNEAAPLQRLFDSLNRQAFPREKIEVIVVDNGSTDSTAEVARKNGAKVVWFDQKHFSYPASSNAGVSAAKAPLIVMISAHCTLYDSRALTSAATHFANPEVAGVYGPVLSIRGAGTVEWLASVPSYLVNRLLGARRIATKKMGIMGATNCMLRKSDWDSYPFNEAWGAGAEDADWAGEMLQRGKQIVYDPAFSVDHAHKLSLIGYIRQWKLWMKLYSQGPQPFRRDELWFRKDITHD